MKILFCVGTRPECVETGHLYLCDNPENLESLVYKINNDYYINNECPYGDGDSSNKILNILKI